MAICGYKPTGIVAGSDDDHKKGFACKKFKTYERVGNHWYRNYKYQDIVAHVSKSLKKK